MASNHDPHLMFWLRSLCSRTIIYLFVYLLTVSGHSVAFSRISPTSYVRIFLPVGGKMFLLDVVILVWVHTHGFFAVDICGYIVRVCVFGLLLSLCSCFWRSSGWAPDCCPLLWHCPIEPKAVWLPLQATLSMATFHSHLFKHLTLAYTYKNLKNKTKIINDYL